MIKNIMTFPTISMSLALYILLNPNAPELNKTKAKTGEDRKMLESLEERLDNLREKMVRVTVTAYSPIAEECDDDPYVTAFNKLVKTGSIAISKDLERELGWKLGDMVHLHGLGTFEVWDRMPSKWNRRVDIFFFDTDEARTFGVKNAIAEKISSSREKT